MRQEQVAFSNGIKFKKKSETLHQAQQVSQALKVCTFICRHQHVEKNSVKLQCIYPQKGEKNQLKDVILYLINSDKKKKNKKNHRYVYISVKYIVAGKIIITHQSVVLQFLSSSSQ